MRTSFALALTLAMFVSFAFFAGSGFNAMVEGETGGGPLSENVEDAANNTSAAGENGNLSGSRRGSDDGSIVGIVISSAGTIGQFVGLVALLPLTLQNLGFPAWFATPVGGVINIIMGIGLIQFVTGRVYD